MASRRGYGEGAISARKDRRGRVTGYQVRITLDDGRRHTVGTYPTKREASKAAQKAQVEASTGRLVTSGRQTVGDYLSTWLEAKRRSIRYKTWVTYRTAIRHATAGIGGIRLDALRPSHVEKLERDLADHKGARTAQQVHAVLQSALNRAVQLDLMGRNPMAAVFPPRPERRERPSLTLEQAQVLFDATAGDWFHALYVTVVTTGLRQGEALGLAWDDVDLDAQTLAVRRSQHFETGRGLVLDDLKTPKSRRIIPLTTIAVMALRSHGNRQRERRLVLGPGWTESGRVFTSESGSPLDAANVLKRYYCALRSAGLPRVTFHDLRHTSASLMASEGIPLHLMQAILGHANSRTTMDIYTHVFATDLDTVRHRMDAAFSKAAQLEERTSEMASSGYRATSSAAAIRTRNTKR